MSSPHSKWQQTATHWQLDRWTDRQTDRQSSVCVAKDNRKGSKRCAAKKSGGRVLRVWPGITNYQHVNCTKAAKCLHTKRERERERETTTATKQHIYTTTVAATNAMEYAKKWINENVNECAKSQKAENWKLKKRLLKMLKKKRTTTTTTK